MNYFQRFYHTDLEKVYRNFTSNDKNESVIISKENKYLKGRYKKIVLDNIIGETKDVYNMLTSVRKHTKDDGVVLLSYYNHLWEPLLQVASDLDLRKEVPDQNWLDQSDLINLLNLAGFEVITSRKRVLLPISTPVLSPLFNKLLANIPILNSLCLSVIVIARPKPKPQKELRVSIVIPARNESGNISKIIPSIPKFGKSQEFVFVEGNSTDDTWEEIIKESKNRKNVKTAKQSGIGKANAVWQGFSIATGQILMIYDADMTVHPNDLPKFYKSIRENPNSFVNGSRMVYPMENQAMQSLNKIGNKIFGYLFTWILGQRFKDTLCGTKVIFKSDFEMIKNKYRKFFKMDPFGDFVLIFGAVKLNLKIIEIPIRYRERIYGTTNISRFKHGLMLLKMTVYAIREFLIL